MSIPKRLDPLLARQLRKMLSQMNVSERRVTIDFDKETIEIEEEYPAQETLESIGIISLERGKELEAEVKKMREEDWE